MYEIVIIDQDDTISKRIFIPKIPNIKEKIIIEKKVYEIVDLLFSYDNLFNFKEIIIWVKLIHNK